jgi:hypothetical protein
MVAGDGEDRQLDGSDELCRSLELAKTTSMSEISCDEQEIRLELARETTQRG